MAKRTSNEKPSPGVSFLGSGRDLGDEQPEELEPVVEQEDDPETGAGEEAAPEDE